MKEVERATNIRHCPVCGEHNMYQVNGAFIECSGCGSLYKQEKWKDFIDWNLFLGNQPKLTAEEFEAMYVQKPAAEFKPMIDIKDPGPHKYHELIRKLTSNLLNAGDPVKKKVRKTKQANSTTIAKVMAMFEKHKYCTSAQLEAALGSFGRSIPRVLWQLCKERAIIRLDHGLYMRND